jgi:hypothetical protein
MSLSTKTSGATVYLDRDDDDLCQCGHGNGEHDLVFRRGNNSTMPCGAGDRFDVGADGCMVLVEEACSCRDYQEG